MLDFDIQRCTRKCFVTGKDFLPGEAFYSVLVADGANVVRYDYSVASWPGPPEGNLGFWKSQMPELNAKRVQLAPSEVMLNYFAELESRPDKEDERYVLALLLVRRRLLREERTETDPLGRETLVLYSSKTEAEYRTPIVTPSPERASEIQEQIGRLLFVGQG